MSDYGAYDEPRRYKSTRTRPRDRDEPEFIEETTYVERGKGPPPRDLVYRGRDDSVEDIPRDFPPPDARSRARPGRSDYYDDYDEPPRRARSAYSGRRGGGSRYDDDDYSDYAAPAAGAVAGYKAGRRDRDRESRVSRRGGYYSDEESPPPRRKDRRKSGIEETLEGLGLGGIAGSFLGKKRDGSRDRSRSRARSRYGGSSSRSPPREERRERQWAQAAQAAIVAGAVEAFRVRNEPGGWKGDKGKRIATAAIGAGGIDKLIDRDPNEKTKRHLVEAVLGGLVANRLANGPREPSTSRGRSQSRSRSVMDRFRSKSRGRSSSRDGSVDSRARSKSGGGGHGLEKVLGAGAVAAAGKAIYDRVRSKSRGAKDRARDESESDDGYDNRSRSRRGRDVGSSRSVPPNGRNPDDGAVVGPRGRAAGEGAGAVALANGNGEGKERGKRDSSSESQSSTDMENQRKKTRKKEYITAALASIATIHAAHGVYSSMEASEQRHKLVAEGEMSKEEARKKRSKAWLQDAAAVGIAALGIKGAFSEWKEMNNQRTEVREIEQRHLKRQKRRQQRMKEARNGGGGGGGGGYGGGYGDRQQQSLPPSRDDYYGGGGGGPSTYQDGNPYSSGRLPPPPMGAQDGRYA